MPFGEEYKDLYIKKQNNHIVSFSGGKDSTAMLLMMIEKNMPIDDIVFCDTGMEFPIMYDHISRVEQYIDMEITIIKSEKTYEYYLGEHVKKNGQVGYGHPDFRNRWCTQMLKKSVFAKYLKGKKDVTEYHGIVFDEKHRTENNNEKNIRYPLVEWEIIEREALQYCYDKGFDWGGLYENFMRVSCWCCPLSRIGELKTLYNEYPELWAKLEELDKKSFRRFRSDYSLQELKEKFQAESKQMELL